MRRTGTSYAFLTMWQELGEATTTEITRNVLVDNFTYYLISKK